MNTADEYSSWDAAYVLGALTTLDRQAFERHLATCDECRDSVQSLAGLPGLLAPTRESVLSRLTEPTPPVPDTLLPALIATVDQRRRRRRWITTVSAAAAAVIVVALGVVAVQARQNTAPPTAIATASPAPEIPMTPLMTGPMTASVQLTRKAWGTGVTVRCAYEAGAYGRPWYALVVTDRFGDTEQAAAWTGIPGTSAVVQAATSYHPDEIASVEVTIRSGDAILKAKP